MIEMWAKIFVRNWWLSLLPVLAFVAAMFAKRSKRIGRWLPILTAIVAFLYFAAPPAILAILTALYVKTEEDSGDFYLAFAVALQVAVWISISAAVLLSAVSILFVLKCIKTARKRLHTLP